MQKALVVVRLDCVAMPSLHLPRPLAALLALLLALPGCAGTPPLSIPAGEDPLQWQWDIDLLAAQSVPASSPVVFVGSSSIKGWTSLAADMAPIPVLNCGFGGSRIFDTTWHLDRIVTPFAPRAVVVFAGTNDIAGESPRSAAYVEERFVELVTRLRALGCEAPLLYLAITMAPSREQHVEIVREANARIAARAATMRGVSFVDASASFVDASGRPDPKWFLQDRLHLGSAGYAEWTRVVRPALERVLEGR